MMIIVIIMIMIMMILVIHSNLATQSITQIRVITKDLGEEAPGGHRHELVVSVRRTAEETTPNLPTNIA